MISTLHDGQPVLSDFAGHWVALHSLRFGPPDPMSKFGARHGLAHATVLVLSPEDDFGREFRNVHIANKQPVQLIRRERVERDDDSPLFGWVEWHDIPYSSQRGLWFTPADLETETAFRKAVRILPE